tara:strand:+ start:79 stop:483 length:405 start_codon:yes stop_codon:yes gene_type:complete
MAKKPTKKSSLNCINLRNQLYNSNIYLKTKEFKSRICCDDPEKSPPQRCTPKIVKIDRPLTPIPKSMIIRSPKIIRPPDENHIDENHIDENKIDEKKQVKNHCFKSTTPPPRENNLRLELKSPKKQEEETFVFL